jgi:hypothetical protein
VTRAKKAAQRYHKRFCCYFGRRAIKGQILPQQGFISVSSDRWHGRLGNMTIRDYALRQPGLAPARRIGAFLRRSAFRGAS